MNINMWFVVGVLVVWLALWMGNVTNAGALDDLEQKLKRGLSDATHKGIDSTFGSIPTSNSGSSQASQAGGQASQQQTGGGSQASTSQLDARIHNLRSWFLVHKSN